MKKIIIPMVIVVLIMAAGAFYFGTKYGQSKVRSEFGNLRNLSPEERQQRFQEMSANMGDFAGRIGNRAGANFINGEIIDKDEQSVTIKLRDGGSKIVFYSKTTEIGKFTNGALEDLEIGKTVSVNGQENEDGSLTAQSIQIRPEMAPL